MSSGTRTFGLDETLIEPRVLPPPPTRHALFLFLILLASIVHIGTAGWSEIHNGAEGHYASAARAMFRSGHGLSLGGDASKSPLLASLLACSFQLFGVSTAAARFPIAAATIASVALTFLIGERLAGYWRGFAAGLMHLCCLGTFIWGRIVTPAPVSSALLGATIFCAVCGYQRQQRRRWWFAGVWFFAALAWMIDGSAGLLMPAGIILLLAAFYREARMRFRLLLDWRYILLFLCLVGAWQLWSFQHGGEIRLEPRTGADGMSLPRFLLVHGPWWFPLPLLVLPAVLLAPRRVLRPHEFEFADALPLVWMAVGFLPLFFSPHRQDYDSLPMWSGLALWVACVWDRTPRALRLAAIALTLLAGVAIAGLALLGAEALPVLPPSPWPSARMVVALIGLALLGSCLLASYFAWRHREDFALAIIMLAMVTIGLGAAEAMARYGAQFSFADAAHFLQPQLGDAGQVLYEGAAYEGSSLGFYLDRPPTIVNREAAPPQLTPSAAMDQMSAAHPVFLLVHKDRLSFWQQHLTERFHLYHQAGTCGSYVVIDNQP